MTNTAETRPDDWPSFAVTGDKTRPTPDANIASGFPQTTVPPTRQEFNWAFNQVFKGVRYLLQNGTPDWSATESFPSGAVVRRGGLIYTASSSNINIDPATNPGTWERSNYTLSQMNAQTATQLGSYVTSSYLAANYVSNGSLTATLTNYVTTAQLAAAGLISTVVTPVIETVAAGDLAVFFDGIGVGKWKKPPRINFATVNMSPFSSLETSGAIRGSTTVMNATASTVLDVQALPDGGFVEFWWITGVGHKFRLFNADGTARGAEVLATNSSATATGNLSVTTDGGFVISYYDGTRTAWKRYTNAGVLVTSGTNTNGTNGVNNACVALSDGGFVTIYNTAATVLKFSRYNSSNTIQQTDITIATGGGNISSVNAVPVVGGGFAISYIDASSTFVILAVYTVLGVIVGSAQTAGAASGGGTCSVGCLTNGDLVISWTQASLNPQWRRYNSSATAQGAAQDFAIGSISGVTYTIGTLDGGFFISYTTSVTVYRFNATGGGIGTFAFTAPVSTQGFISQLADGGVVMSWQQVTTNYVAFTRYAANAVTVTGAYTVGGSAGATATMATSGTQSLTASYTPGNILHGGGKNPGINGAIFGQQLQSRGLA